MKFGISLVMRGDSATPEGFERVAEKAEGAGLDSLWCSDHLVIPPRTVSKYPGRSDGNFPDTWLQRYWEPISVLGYLAARTSKISLGTSVLILPMRNPVEKASEIANLDQLSRGRIILGVGVGWFQEEFDLLGIPFKERGARTDEGLEICKALWTQEKPSYHGKFHQFDNVNFGPRPVQKPHPPIWIAGHSPRALRRVARLGDGWHPLKPTYEALETQKAELEKLLEVEGRTMSEITIGIKGHMVFGDTPAQPGQWPLEGRPQDMIDGLRRYQELGVEHVTLDIIPETPDVAIDVIERFTQEVRPHL